MIVANPHTKNKNLPLGMVSSNLVNPEISLKALDNPTRAKEQRKKRPNSKPYASDGTDIIAKSLSVTGEATMVPAVGN